MNGGATRVGSVPLIRKVREALGADRSAAGDGPRSHASMRRDIDGLLSRLDGLRRRFPANQALLARVGISPHVMRLLDEGRDGGLARGGEDRW
jgi:hypothetical protein